MKQHKFKLSNGETQRKTIPGNFFRLHEAAGKVNIKVDGVTNVDLEAGQQVKVKSFDTFEITDKSGVENNIVLVVGFGGYDNSTIKGSVDAVVFEPDYSKDENHYIGFANTDAVAASYAVNQLWNPVGSGAVLYVEKLRIKLSVDCDIRMMVGSDPAANTMTSYTANKYIGGASALGGLRHQNVARLAGMFSQAIAYDIPVSSLDYKELFNSPGKEIILPEGWGIHVETDGAAVNLKSIWEWRQKAA